jgi:hypothetical protein
MVAPGITEMNGLPDCSFFDVFFQIYFIVLAVTDQQPPKGRLLVGSYHT